VSIAEPFTDYREECCGKEKDKEDKEASGVKKQRKYPVGKIILQIGIALIVGIPLVLILSFLLASSDAVFAEATSTIMSMFEYKMVPEIFGRVFLFVLLLPFAGSVVWSYKKEHVFFQKGVGKGSDRPTHFPEITVITVLVLVNLLYLLFAGIQSVYLFGAWAGTLPGDMTYAEYARSGFFELAAISLINAGMILLAIRYTGRTGKTGHAIRILSVMLIALSGVQLASAMRRMFLYVDVFGLTEDRYYVTAFMIMMAILFGFLLLREFIGKFPLLKSALTVCVLSLLIVNYSVPGNRIANYNIDRYLEGDTSFIDVMYLSRMSADSLSVLLEREDEILAGSNAKLAGELITVHIYVDMDYFGEEITIDNESGYCCDSYESQLSDSWKHFNFSIFRILDEE
jgi:hypothetical protein